MKKLENEIEKRVHSVLPTLNERQRRLYLAAEAKSLGYGGITRISAISGISRQTITAGVREIDNGQAESLPVGRNRKAGAGRKMAKDRQPGLEVALLTILEANSKGDPMSLLRWTSKSLRNIEADLKAQGFTVSYQTISELIRKNDFYLQGNRKDMAVQRNNPDRNTQFEYINEQSKLFFLHGAPVISVDAKKKEKVGNFKNEGQEYRKKGNPQKVLDHDFPDKELGSATPYGIYEIFRNKGFVSVGISGDTAEFAVETIRKWWNLVGKSAYPNAEEMMITADCGGGNGYRVRLWKVKLQKFANEIKKKITVSHFPPGTSKWNKIEHRLFSFISKNWCGQPLISLAVIINLIAATTTREGLTVKCVLDNGTYVRGIEVSDEEFDAINIKQHTFHGEWNYTISPQ
jgi:hypothetical protein